jgi:hypothetical protein
MFPKGARLVEPTWYPVKIGFLETIVAMGPATGGVDQDAKESFAEENGVKSMQLTCLGRPKEHKIHA